MDPAFTKIQQLLYTTQMLTEELEIVYGILDNLFEEEDYDLPAEVLVEKKKWIQNAIKKEGSLRKTLKAKKDKNIPVSKLKKAAEKGGKTGKRARLALTLRKLNEQNEQQEGSWDDFIGLVGQAKREFVKTLPPGTKSIGQDVLGMLDTFTNDPSEKGDNVTDDLIQRGFPAELIGKAAGMRRGAIARLRRAQGSADPSFGGTYKPRGDPNASPFD
jgi:hypothetical protein